MKESSFRHLRNRLRSSFWAVMIFTVVLAVCQARAENFFQASSALRGLSILPPRISGITTTTFLASWDPPIGYNYSTHYQVRVNGALYGASTLGYQQLVSWQIPGNTVTVDYVIYHEGTVLGISSATRVLLGPPTPEGLYADQIGTSSFRLTWVQTPTATSYAVYVDGQLATTVAAPQTSATITNLQPGKTIKINLVARNSSGVSLTSKDLVVQLVPTAPALTLTVNGIGQTWFRIAWNPVLGAATYTISCNATTTTTEVGSETLSYVVNVVTAGASYTARVKASNPSGYSELSNEVQVLLYPPTPDRPIAYTIGASSFWLEWLPVPNVIGYKVYRDTDEQMYTVPESIHRVLCNRGFNPGDIASMSVSCYNKTGDSPQSAQLTVKLLSSLALASGPLSELLASEDPNARRPGDSLDVPGILSALQGDSRLMSTLAGKPLLMAVLDDQNQRVFQKQLEVLTDLARSPDFANMHFVTMAHRFAETAPVTAIRRPANLLLLPDASGALSKSLAAGRHSILFLLDSGHLIRGMATDFDGPSLRKKIAELLAGSGLSHGPDAESLKQEQKQFDSLHRP